MISMRTAINLKISHKLGSQLQFFKEKLYSKALDFFFPQPCVYCEAKRISGGPYLCGMCQDAIQFISSSYCYLCGIPANLSYEDSKEKFLCGSCRTKPPTFEKARSLGIHQGVLRKLIHELKYGMRPGVMQEIESLLEIYFSNRKLKGFYVTPIPLHLKKLKQREFDQAYLIGQKVAEILGLAFLPEVLERVVETQPQASLNKPNRLKNVRGAFRSLNEEKIQGRNILLVDDVFTTGATLNEGARMLKRAKANHVYVFSLARAN
jgi:ComF family protein